MANRILLTTAVGATTLVAAAAALGIAGTADPVAAPVGNSAALSALSTSTPTTSARPSTSSADPTGSATTAPAAPSSGIGPEEAASIALAHVGGGRVGKIESEFEHGRHEWKVEVHGGGRVDDVRVDAATGAITRTDRDGRDDRDDRDDHRGRDHHGDRDDHGSHRGRDGS